MKRLLLVAVLLGGSAACSNTPSEDPAPGETHNDNPPDAGMQADASHVGDAGSPDPEPPDAGAVLVEDAGPMMDASDGATDDSNEDEDAGPPADEVQPGLQFNGATTIVRREP
jgi:hypothetical protein